MMHYVRGQAEVGAWPKTLKTMMFNDGVQPPKTQSNDVRQMSQDVEGKPVRQVSDTHPDYFIILD